MVANGDTRSIYLQHTHRDDEITVTFKRNGRYDEDGLKKLNYFLRDWRNDDQTRMDPQLFDILWEVTREVDAKEPIHIVSSYRSPATNAMLRRRSRGVAQFSQHMLGKAIDFNIPGVSVEDLRVAGLRLQRGGVGFYPGSFVHVDVGTVRHWPRMTHDQLARVFPNGRTVHVPSDGQPLAGYALALADIEKRGSSPSGMSLAAARSSGAIGGEEQRVASAAKPKKGNVLATLFGFSTDEDEEDDSNATPAPAETRVAAAAKPAQEARVPTAAGAPAAIRRRAQARGRLRARLGDLHARSRFPRAPCRARRPTSPSRPRSAPRAARRRRASRPGSMTPIRPHRPRAARHGARLCGVRVRAGRPAPDRADAADGRDARRAGRDHADRPHPAEGRPALQRSLAARHHARDQRALRDERHGLRQARRAPGAHDDDQAGRQRADDVRRRPVCRACRR